MFQIRFRDHQCIQDSGFLQLCLHPCTGSFIQFLRKFHSFIKWYRCDPFFCQSSSGALRLLISVRFQLTLIPDRFQFFPRFFQLFHQGFLLIFFRRFLLQKRLSLLLIIQPQHFL